VVRSYPYSCLDPFFLLAGPISRDMQLRRFEHPGRAQRWSVEAFYEKVLEFGAPFSYAAQLDVEAPR
jgi:hypothetical protein